MDKCRDECLDDETKQELADSLKWHLEDFIRELDCPRARKRNHEAALKCMKEIHSGRRWDQRWANRINK